MAVTIRAFRQEDGGVLNQIARLSFAEYEEHVEDWAFVLARWRWGSMSDLDEQGQLIIAEDGGVIAGGVCFIDSYTPKSPWFDADWSVIRSLVVSPIHRGKGIGTRLTETCIDRARQDHSRATALRTSPVMIHAVRIYERMGFQKIADLGIDQGLQWHVYCKYL